MTPSPKDQNESPELQLWKVILSGLKTHTFVLNFCTSNADLLPNIIKFYHVSMYSFISPPLFVMKITKKLLEKKLYKFIVISPQSASYSISSILFHTPRPQFFSPYYSTYVYISLYNLAFSYLHISYAFKVLHFQVTCLCYFLGLHIYFLIHERRRNTRGMMLY